MHSSSESATACAAVCVDKWGGAQEKYGAVGICSGDELLRDVEGLRGIFEGWMREPGIKIKPV